MAETEYFDTRRRDTIEWVERPPGVAVLVGLFVLTGLLHVFAAIGIGAYALGSAANLFINIPLAGPLLPLVTAGSVFLAIIGVLEFVIAWGVWGLRRWAWGLGLATSILALVVLPYGTLLGILRIVYLAMADVREACKQDGATPRARVTRGRAV